MVRDLHSRGVPHLPVRVRDGIGLVGPLVIPGITSCLDNHPGVLLARKGKATMTTAIPPPHGAIGALPWEHDGERTIRQFKNAVQTHGVPAYI